MNFLALIFCTLSLAAYNPLPQSVSRGGTGVTTLTGIVKGNGTSAFSAATSGTDYAPATSGSLPLFGNGAGGFTNGSVTGNTTKVATSTGSPTSGNCAKWDASGNIIDAGSTCGGGSSSDISTAANQIYAETGNGHGSTNTKVRIFGRIADYSGQQYVTYATSATNGDTFTVATGGAGLYMICYGDYRSGGVVSIAITVNGSALTTNASTPLTFAQGKRALKIGSTNSQNISVCWAGNLADADVVRAQDDGANSGTDARTYFVIKRLGSASTGEIYVDGSPGYGSTNTLVRRYSTSQIATGSGSVVTYADSSTNGMTATVGASGAGTYLVCAMEYSSTSGFAVGLMVNDSVVSTTPSSMTYAQGFRALTYNASVANQSQNACAVLVLAASDVVTVKNETGALPNGTASSVYFHMTRLSAYTDSNMYVIGGAGHGSVNTKYRLFGTPNVSSNLNPVASTAPAMGTEMFIKITGTYVACYLDRTSGSTAITAIMINGRAPTSSASTPLGFATGLRGVESYLNNNGSSVSCASIYAPAGSIVSFQDDGSNDKTDSTTAISFGRIN